ncbi:MAG TPA: DsrE family protein [Usitatibacter sp.]|nr:DsrE family protein [Usitatibacter sp.]
MRIIPILALCALAGGCVSVQGHDEHPMAMHQGNRVVIQVSDNDPAKWNLALNNARNIQSDLGVDNVKIEIVAYGPGLNMLKVGSPVAPRIDEAVVGGAQVAACENTMTAQKVTREQILPGVTYVPAGVVEIMKRQQEGWSYIRP